MFDPISAQMQLPLEELDEEPQGQANTAIVPLPALPAASEVQEVCYRNLCVTIIPSDGSGDVVKLGLKNVRGELFDEVTLDNFDVPRAASELMEHLCALKGDAPLLEVSEFQSVLARSRELGARVKSDYGRSIKQIVRAYERKVQETEKDHRAVAFRYEPGQSLTPMEPGADSEQVDTAGSARLFIDFDTPIKDTSAQAESLEDVLKASIPQLARSLEDEEALFISLRLFSEDPRDECALDRTKLFCFVSDTWIAILHDGPCPPLEELKSILSDTAQAKKMPQSPEEIAVAFVRLCQNRNEEEVSRLGEIIDSLDSDFQSDKQLSPKALEQQMPALVESLTDVTRKLEEAVPFCQDLETRIEDRRIEGGVPRHAKDEKRRIASLVEKAKAYQSAIKELRELDTSARNLRVGDTSKKATIISVGMVPAVAAIAVAQLLQGPTEKCIAAVAGLVVSAACMAYVHARKWY